MSSIEIKPDVLEYKPPFTEQSTEYVTITNGTEETIAFKVKTTAPKFYCVRPNAALVAPGETLQIQVIFLGLAEEPVPNFNCRDKFLVITLPSPNDLGDRSVADAWADLEAQFGAQAISKKIKVKYLTGYKLNEDAGAVQKGAEPQPQQPQPQQQQHVGVDSYAAVQEPPVINPVSTPQRSMATADDITPVGGNISAAAAAAAAVSSSSSSSVPAAVAAGTPGLAPANVATPVKQAVDSQIPEAGNMQSQAETQTETQSQTPVAVASTADTTVEGANTTGYESKIDASKPTPRKESEGEVKAAPAEEVTSSSPSGAPAKKESSLNLAPLIIIAIIAFIVRWLYSRFSA